MYVERIHAVAKESPELLVGHHGSYRMDRGPPRIGDGSVLPPSATRDARPLWAGARALGRGPKRTTPPWAPDPHAAGRGWGPTAWTEATAAGADAPHGVSKSGFRIYIVASGFFLRKLKLCATIVGVLPRKSCGMSTQGTTTHLYISCCCFSHSEGACNV